MIQKLPEPYTLFLKIDKLPVHQANVSRHWRVRHAATKEWDQIIALSVVGKKPRRPLTGAKVTFIRHGSRYLDGDNLAISHKAVLDALVTAGILADDSWSVVGMPIYDQVIAKEKPHFITIHVEEINR